MEYRKLPHGTEQECFSVLGLGMGGIQHTPAEEIEAVIRKAIAHGINFFDLCAGGKVYEPFAKAIKGQREKVFLQVHFGAVYDEHGEYGWCRDFDTIKKTFLWELETLDTDYVDFGFLHCVDTSEDFDKLIEIGVLDYLKTLKEQGIVRHIGFSSHTPEVANRILDTGLIDMMMFSINPAYDFEKGDEYGIGSVRERKELFYRCQREGVGISVMKPFFAGQLLDADQSPFGVALNHYQCIQYAIDRPGVLVTVPGVQTMEHLDTLLGFLKASEEEKDYSVIATFTADKVMGTCVYCNHCQPCPEGIDIGLVNKYYDLALAGDALAVSHYDKLSVKADACIQCGHCDSRCPFQVKQSERMREIREKLGKHNVQSKAAYEETMMFPIGAFNAAFAPYFSGSSYLAPISQSQVPIFNVTFEPGCRNNWHVHHADQNGGQILICVAGRGYYQEWGKDAVEMKPGDCINIPTDVKHWHGAAPDSWFSHLAVEVPGENGSTEWLEAVEESEYQKLK